MIDRAIRDFIAKRADFRCEYCHLRQAAYEAIFNVDHVTASQHVQDDSIENLAFCCPKCNRKKGSNLAGIDPVSGSVVILFHPRRNDWNDHFRLSGSQIVGITPAGRATVSVLDLNHEDRVRLREMLIKEGIL